MTDDLLDTRIVGPGAAPEKACKYLCFIQLNSRSKKLWWS